MPLNFLINLMPGTSPGMRLLGILRIVKNSSMEVEIIHACSVVESIEKVSRFITCIYFEILN